MSKARIEAQRELLEDVLKRIHAAWYEPESDQDRESLEHKERKRQAIERALRIRHAILRRDIDRLNAALRVVDDDRGDADQRRFLRVACFLDHALDAGQAEEVIGDLFEQYVRRLSLRRRYVRSWLWTQAGWISLNRGIDLLGRVRKAWAGK